jgi:hypothetical protein
MDGMQVLYHPKHLSSDELEIAFFACMRRAYTLRLTTRRILARTELGLLRRVGLARVNMFYRRFHLALAKVASRRADIRRNAPCTQNSTKPSLA